MVPDWDFVNSAAQTRYFDREFRLESETITAKPQRIQDLAPKHFVSNLHICEVQVAEHVAKESQRLVAQVVPEVEHAMRAAMKSIPEYHVGKTFEDGFEQLGIVARIVFKVSILNQNYIAGRMCESGAQRRALALILFVKHELDRYAKGRLHSPS